MTEFSPIEAATLAVAQKQIDDAKAAFAVAQADYNRKVDAVQAAQAALAALGPAPDVGSYATSADWQAATAEHQFQSTRLQRAVFAVESPMNEAGTSLPALQEAVAQAQRAMSTAQAHVHADRLAAAVEPLTKLAAAFWEARKGVPTGYVVDLPHGVSINDAGFGVTRLTVVATYDHRAALAL